MGRSLPLRRVLPGNLFLNLLPRTTRQAFLRCIKLKTFTRLEWYLAGGTALALQVGHRQSVDLDFFTPRGGFEEIAVERALLNIGGWQTTFREKGTIYGILAGGKISLTAYPFFVPKNQMLRCGTVRILAPPDIAAMKVIAISQRGRKRDFVDLYWYCVNRENLKSVILRAIKQYPGQKHNMPHFLKSLTYFADAEQDPMPKIFFDADWKTIKSFFLRETSKAAKELLGLK